MDFQGQPQHGSVLLHDLCYHPQHVALKYACTAWTSNFLHKQLFFVQTSHRIYYPFTDFPSEGGAFEHSIIFYPARRKHLQVESHDRYDTGREEKNHVVPWCVIHICMHLFLHL